MKLRSEDLSWQEIDGELVILDRKSWMSLFNQQDWGIPGQGTDQEEDGRPTGRRPGR